MSEIEGGTGVETQAPQAEPRAAAAPARPVPPAYAPPPSRAASSQDPRAKSPALASFLSLMPGLGQVYVGYYQRGFVHVLVVASLITLLAADLRELTPLAGFFLAFFWLYNVIDAGRRASLYNQYLLGAEVPDLPSDFRSPGLRGSMAGGVALIGAGILLLLHTRFGISLAWVRDWWPAVLVLLGAYLLGKALLERSVSENRS